MGCVTPAIVLFSCLGLGLSLYAIHIERTKEADESYRASCDLDETIACSYVLTSNYSTGLGLIEHMFGREHFLNIPNSYAGVLFFPAMLILGLISSKTVLLFSICLCFVSCLTSAYLMYVLVAILHKICLVCMGVHFLNLLLFILFTLKWRTAASGRVEKTKTKKLQ